MNIHIKLVKKWLADPTSVTQQELEDNRDAADAATDAAYADAAHAATDAAYADAAHAAHAAYAYAAYAYAAATYAAYAAAAAAAYAAYDDDADAKKWVKRYEELTK